MKTYLRLVSFVVISLVCYESFAQDKIDVLILNKKYNEALILLDGELQKSPTAQLYFKKGLVYNSIQNYQAALNSYTKALQLDPDNAEILGEMAEGLSVLGNNQDAIEFFKKAINVKPDNLVLAGQLGRVYINLKEYQNAYDVFANIYLQDSSNVFWNKQFAYCSFRVFKRKQAVYLYEKVLEANPRDYGSYSNLIHSYNWKKEGNSVMATIDKGLDQFPYDAELILERANYFFKTKQYGPAMINFENYFEADGDSIYEIAMNYGISTYFAQQEEKALSIFNDLNRANPNDGIVMYYIGLCYKKLKDYPNAEKNMQWAIDVSYPDYLSEMYHLLGQIYGQQRKFKESIAALNKAYDFDPQKHEILFEIATTYEEFNSNKTLALNYYRIYLKEAGAGGENINYALDRITRIKEDLFFEE
ncbi:tetratricopeptide repeat protein [Draconibacterium sp.]|nr:tetratricopeptide repeat protein [Draconibacterium sp.]